MVGSSVTLPRNREALRLREMARQAQAPEVDPGFARIAEALQPDETTPAARTALFAGLGSVFGFAAAWLLVYSLDAWYVVVALGMSAGGMLGAVMARLSDSAGHRCD